MDARLIALAREAGDACYDPAERLVRLPAHGNRVHTRIQSGLVHPFRHSLTYALAVLESGDSEPATEPAAELATELAAGILTRVVAGQDADPRSDTFGVWSYVAEEPLPAMVRPDPNWADFLGQELLYVAFRHAAALPGPVLDDVLTAIERAATAVRRRDVSMAYTNIAAKGTFVTLAAGELLGDDVLLEYGRTRIARFAAEVEGAGSFAEYNSPTYWLVTCEAVGAIAQFVADEQAIEIAARIRDRLWWHLVRRWHPPTGQLGGPMSRAYATDLAADPLLLAFLAKAAGHRPPFDATPATVAGGTSKVVHRLGLTSVAIIDPAAPPAVVRALTEPAVHVERREVFSGGPPARVGTTWLGPGATLGSVNHADSWYQRRNLLGFWQGPGEAAWQRPVRYVRLRVVKDGYDFVSGMFSSVQDARHVLWCVGLASPGGDRHVYRDEIEGPAPIRSLRVSFEFGNAGDARVNIDGRDAGPGSRFEVGETVTVVSGDTSVVIGFAGAEFGGPDSGMAFGGGTPRGRVRLEDGALFVDLDLLDLPEPIDLDLAEVGAAWAAGTLTLVEGTVEGAADDHASAARAVAGAPVHIVREGDAVRLTWTPGARLELRGRAVAGPVDAHAAAYVAAVDGRPARTDLDPDGGLADARR